MRWTRLENRTIFHLLLTMRPRIVPQKVECGDKLDIVTTKFASANAIKPVSSRGVPTTTTRGPMPIKSTSAPEIPVALTKTIAAEDLVHRESVESRGASTLRRLSTHISGTLIPSAQTRSTCLQLLFAAVVGVCLLWTLWLIFLNVAPNYTVNLVMNTEHFDNGVFWLFVDPSPSILWLSVSGLSIIGVGYVYILVKMVIRPERVEQTPPTPHSSFTIVAKRPSDTSSTAEQIAHRVTSSAKYVVAFVTTDSVPRRFAKLGLKVGDLAFETVLLIQILENGSPAPIVVIFTIVTASNALVCAMTMFMPFQRIGLVETLTDLLFDLLIAVGCPMLVLVYCLSTFSFPRDKFAVNQEIFPTGWFEQQASILADPAQTAVIYKSLKSLRISSILDWFARMGVHATLFLRLRKLVSLIQDPRTQRIPVYPRRHRPTAAIFIVYAILLIMFVEESARTSAIACDPHPECVVYARRWTFVDSGSLTQCPCLTMVDRDIAPKTYAEWEQPLNVTDKVAQLAATGDLQTLKLTNRFLPILPEDLRRCINMRHLTLEYTHTQTLPDWITTFSQLEFLHLESKYSVPFELLPNDMFEHMSSLTFIHFAGFLTLKRLPSFQGLSNLKSLTLAALLKLEELPTFDSLRRLERLLIACIPSLDSLPDFAPISQVKSLVLNDRGTWCCNGFLGECNLDHPMCQVHPVWGTPAAKCLPSDRVKASPETLTLLDKHRDNVCTRLLLPGTLEDAPTQATMDPCNGTLYRQCTDPSGVESMCYNARFMGISCDSNPFPIKMRRLQIGKGIGDVCNPQYEAWLGCTVQSPS